MARWGAVGLRSVAIMGAVAVASLGAASRGIASAPQPEAAAAVAAATVAPSAATAAPRKASAAAADINFGRAAAAGDQEGAAEGPAPSVAPAAGAPPHPTRSPPASERAAAAPVQPNRSLRPPPATANATAPPVVYSADMWNVLHHSRKAARQAHSKDAGAEAACASRYFEPPQGPSAATRWPGGGCSAWLRLPCSGPPPPQPLGAPPPPRSSGLGWSPRPPLFFAGPRRGEATLCRCGPTPRPHGVAPVAVGHRSGGNLSFADGSSFEVERGAVWFGAVRHIHLGHLLVDVVLPMLAAVEAAAAALGISAALSLIVADDGGDLKKRPGWEMLTGAVAPTVWWSSAREQDAERRCFAVGVWGLPPVRGACARGESMVGSPFFAAPSPDEAYLARVRLSVARFVGPSPPAPAGHGAPWAVAILGRKGYARRVANAAELVLWATPGLKLELLDWETVGTLREQAAAAGRLAAVVAVHGNAHFWAVGMREGSVMVEVMPASSPCNASCVGGTIDSGINRADLPAAVRRGTQFYAALARRLAITHIGWQSRGNATSPEPTAAAARAAGYDAVDNAQRRCTAKTLWRPTGEQVDTETSWMCRNVVIPERQWRCLSSEIARLVGRFDGVEADLPAACLDDESPAPGKLIRPAALLRHGRPRSADSRNRARKSRMLIGAGTF
eukprot:TRINITY_DN51737_c0_g1_i1.p1 TRINITY_DN51737_c0_g1~~TRINITY_DN51737_c0_g1_i1.p1  ORF type:complete len:701 (+),score=176.41 TRINITY_DN51737_c0_g1_i1:81-2105(+)